MTAHEFYNYIVQNFSLDGTASRLVRNIVEYVENQKFTDAMDAHILLKSLLDGAFGIEEQEIKLYHAPVCESCGKYVSGGDDGDDIILCPECRAKKNNAVQKESNRVNNPPLIEAGISLPDLDEYM